jgi:preprotein translocase subunit YajC
MPRNLFRGEYFGFWDVMGKKEEGIIRKVVDGFQAFSLMISIRGWILIVLGLVGGELAVIPFLEAYPLLFGLFCFLLALILVAIIAIFVNRKEEKRREEEKKQMLVNLEKELIIKKAGMRKATTSRDQLPVVEFKIAVERKMHVKLEPQKILLDLTCDIIPQKTFFGDRGYNIEDLKEDPDIEAPDIEATENGHITIRYQCMNVFYKHNYVHNWKIKGRITLHTEIGDITKGMKLVFNLDKEAEEEFKKDLKRFQGFYVEGGYKPVS